MTQSSDAEHGVQELDYAYSRQDSLAAEQRRLNGLRVALPFSLGLFVVLGIILFGEAFRMESRGPAMAWWASSFLVLYVGAVAVNESIARRRLLVLRSEQLEIEARLKANDKSELPGPAF